MNEPEKQKIDLDDKQQIMKNKNNNEKGKRNNE